MTPATKRLHDELASKPRIGWEKNGFEDALTGLERVPVGARMSVTDRYMQGWREGNQVRCMREAAQNDGFKYDQAKMFPFASMRRMTD